MNIPFSKRYGYAEPTNVVVREELSGAILNSILNAFTDLYGKLSFPDNWCWTMNIDFARYYLNMRLDQIDYSFLYYRYFIVNENNEWYERIDAIEWVIGYHRNQIEKVDNSVLKKQIRNSLDSFVYFLNQEFDRLNYAYRIINYIFVETTSKNELSTINETLETVDNDVVTHLSECLKLISPSNPKLSTRNAIKEAISAVELIARKVTNTNTLDNAFKKFTKLHPLIRSSMMSLYQYTNQSNTGIRHAWMEQTEEPSKDEAIFVLVTGCAFINYIRKLYNN